MHKNLPLPLEKPSNLCYTLCEFKFKELTKYETIFCGRNFTTSHTRAHKIEFLGDSVTSGEGLCGAKSLNLWIPSVFSSRGNYAKLTAEALDADFAIY